MQSKHTEGFGLKSLEQLPLPLLEWYRDNARTLPWRSDPTPYHVWISEIMLQQTRVAAVLDYYRRFLEELPTVQALAAVEEDRLLKLWQGLGYYNRARNLQKAARTIVEDFGGRFPDTYEAILSLPGIGEYTAGAIASIAFGSWPGSPATAGTSPGRRPKAACARRCCLSCPKACRAISIRP